MYSHKFCIAPSLLVGILESSNHTLAR